MLFAKKKGKNLVTFLIVTCVQPFFPNLKLQNVILIIEITFTKKILIFPKQITYNLKHEW